MKKSANFTYTVSGPDGRNESDLSLEEVKRRAADGRITGSTFIQRSDSDRWATAADFQEIGVRDVVVTPFDDEAGPDALTQEVEASGYTRQVRSGAGWFFWIAALSLVNSFCAYTGTAWGYALGLSVTYQIGEIGSAHGAQGKMYALGGNLFLSVLYLFFGLAGWKNYFTPYVLGMFLYAGDTVLACVAEDWISVAIHGVALVFMFQGLNAHMVKRDLPWSGGLILKAAVCFVLVSAGGWVLNAKFNPASKTLPPEAWAGQKPAQWPALALTHDTEFRGHTPLQGATAFLVELPDKRVVAATAKHLLGPDGGVEPRLPLAEVKKALVHWSLHPRSKPQSSVAVTGIHGAPDNYPASDEWLLLDLDAKEPKYPATPLKVRQKPLARGEKVFVVGVRYDNEKNTQEIFPGKITDPGRGLIEGTLDAPANLEGFSGAPIVDADGHVVGLVTGTRSQADRQGRYATFAGHSVEEIRGSPPGAAK